MIAWLVLTHLIAAVPFGLVLSTLYGGDVDIRSAGSGNIGATNVARVYGWKLGLASLVLDVAKGLLPVLGAQWLWPDSGAWWPALVAANAFLAHCMSVFLEFRGGKGVATGAGAMLGIAPGPTALAVVVWLVVLGATGRSSVGALVASVGLIGFTAWLQPAAVPVVVLLAAGIGVTHLSNIRRLMQGEEAQIVRPVRWGRAPASDGAALMAQGPAGTGEPTAIWRE